MHNLHFAGKKLIFWIELDKLLSQTSIEAHQLQSWTETLVKEHRAKRTLHWFHQ